MRLLNTRSLKLEEFVDPPSYAILSHKWGEGEILYGDISHMYSRFMKGYPKIRNCCKQASSEGYDYVWIDTCCIDKSNSSELSEAINRMYSWYRHSEVCYVYLQDVAGTDESEVQGLSFRNSAWFTRGWTLQELLAPSNVIFFASDWTEIGTRTSLADVIKEITNINTEVLVRTSSSTVGVARRMSWAANRQTTRVEDRAYSLMGIFGVNMPILYGEGERAFIRLQYEIIRVSNDHSIFAWEGEPYPSGLLSSSPDQFADASSYDQIQYQEFVDMFGIKNPKPDYTPTNFGVRIQLPMIHIDGNMFLAILACKSSSGTTCIALEKTQELGGYYRRTKHNGQHLLSWNDADTSKIKIEEIFVAGDDSSFYDVTHLIDATTEDSYRFLVSVSGDKNFIVSGVFPLEKWSQGEELSLGVAWSGICGTVAFRNTVTGEMFAAVLGVHNYRLWSDIRVLSEGETAETVHMHYNSAGTDAGNIRWKALDRVKRSLGTHGRDVTISLKRRGVDAHRQVDVHAKIVVASHSTDPTPLCFSRLRARFSRKQLLPWGRANDTKIKIENLFDDLSFLSPIHYTKANHSGTFRFAVTAHGDGNFAAFSISPRSRWSQGGELIMDSGGSGHHGTVVFRNTVTGEAFAAVLGVHNWRVWSDIRVIGEGETADAVQVLYDRAELKDIRQKGLDRVTKPLDAGGKNVLMFIQRVASTPASRQVDLEAKIIIISLITSPTPKEPFNDFDLTLLNSIDYSVIPSRAYRFIVTVSGDSNFAVSGVSPTEKWTHSEELVLGMEWSGHFGTVTFRDTTTGEMFAAVLGVHNWRVWSDIRVMGDGETADTVHGYYNDPNEMGDFRWKTLYRIKKPLNAHGKDILMFIKTKTISTDNQRTDFEAKIFVTSRRTDPLKNPHFDKLTPLYSCIFLAVMVTLGSTLVKGYVNRT